MSVTEGEEVRRNYWHNLGRAKKTRSASQSGREFTRIGTDLSGLTMDEELRLLRLRSQVASHRLDVLRQRMGGQTATARQAIAAIVDDEECTGCGLCREVCPVDAILINEVAIIDSSRCTACLACVRQCPQGAIAIQYPDRPRAVL